MGGSCRDQCCVSMASLPKNFLLLKVKSGELFLSEEGMITPARMKAREREVDLTCYYSPYICVFLLWHIKVVPERRSAQ